MSTPFAIRVWEGQLMTVWRAWRTAVALSLTQPIIFLLGMGLGVGSLVDGRNDAAASLGGLSYLQYLAPALLATAAMTAGSFEATYPVLDGFKWRRTFDAVAVTPIAPRSVVNGLFLWWTTRIVIGSVGVGAALVIIPSTRGWGVPVAMAMSVPVGLAFAAPLAAWTATREDETSFPPIQRFIITPLFLFGGAFYPIESLPLALRPIAWVTPLSHGVQLCRDLTVGPLTLGTTLVHIAVVLAWVAAGYLACQIAFARRIQR
jgi:lipooligosaccharide transport system permease protein